MPPCHPDDAPAASADGAARPVVVVLDVANVVGSRPDGWWRDRAGAARRLLDASAGVLGRVVPDPDAGHPTGAAPLLVVALVAVVEGRAREVADPPAGQLPGSDAARGERDGGGQGEGGLRVVAAPADGDATVVEVVEELVAAGRRVRVVTADRGLRARLPAGVATSGPGWWNALLGR